MKSINLISFMAMTWIMIHANNVTAQAPIFGNTRAQSVEKDLEISPYLL